MIDWRHHTQTLFSLVANGSIDVYNEFSVQHELGICLRASLGNIYRVQFERPYTFFRNRSGNLEKREIDISVFTPDQSTKYAIELKYPASGQYPERMYQACRDILFLEQLRRNGFTGCFFLFLADDPTFYETKQRADGIYQYFRGAKPVHGTIDKPTGEKHESVYIEGNYRIVWTDIKGKLKYAWVDVG